METDSLRQIQLDSLNRLELSIKLFQADNPLSALQLDTNNRIIANEARPVIQLHNFFSPALKLSSTGIGKRIYTEGINSMHFRDENFDDFQFYIPSKALAEISLHRGRAFANSQAAFQDNFDIHLIFASQFRNRIVWNFSYDKDDYLGIYQHNRQKNTVFKTGVHYAGKTDQFHLNFIFRDERHTLQNNWGVVSDTFLINANFSIRESVPVNTNTATTTLFEKSIGFNLDFPIRKSTKGITAHLFVKSFYTDFNYNYFDSDTRNTSSLYQNFWVDSNSIRNILNQKIWTNALSLSFKINENLGGEFTIRNEQVLSDHDTLSYRNPVYQLSSGIHYQLFADFKLNATAGTILLNDQWAAKADLDLSWIKKQSVYASAKLFQIATPIPYIYKRLLLNKNIFWQYDLSNEYIKETGLSVHIKTTQIIHSELNSSWSEFSNFAYLDSMSVPHFLNKVKRIRFEISLPIQIGRIELNSKFNYEYYDPDPSGISGWNSSHKVSINTFLFKKIIHAQIGSRINLYDYQKKLNYNPVLSLYYSATQSNKFIYSVGMFFHFKVSDFSLLLDVENLDSFWIKNRPSLVKGYPLYDFYFSLGIHWRFLN